MDDNRHVLGAQIGLAAAATTRFLSSYSLLMQKPTASLHANIKEMTDHGTQTPDGIAAMERTIQRMEAILRGLLSDLEDGLATDGGQSFRHRQEIPDSVKSGNCCSDHWIDPHF
jgi:hypothetical protein